MIDDKIEIKAGMEVLHDEGLMYSVDGLRIDTTDYERTRQLGGITVCYTQLEDGGMPAGTQYSKDEAGFRANFTVI